MRDVFTVSRLATEVRATLENSFPLLWVEGEISNLSQPRSGHMYFTLKDAGAQVRCALFRNKRMLLRDQPANGDQVLIRARIGFYEARGDFQLIVEHLEASGDGALHRAFEQLKTKLQAEGLFDPARKQQLPAFPKRIGIITSPSGAALRDILQVLKRRAPWIPVIIYPTAVQGAAAPEELVSALQLAQQRGDCDLLLLARGGGSAEDLAGFNDETLARAIAATQIPIISAVGHETDFSISDFIADRRAPTPSAAAELASPDALELLDTVEQRGAQLLRSLRTQLGRHQKRTDSLSHRLNLLHPERRLLQQQQRADELELRLNRQQNRGMQQRRQRLNALQTRLKAQTPQALLRQASARLRELSQRSARITRVDMRRRAELLQAQVRNLHAISPLGTLARGYAIARLTPEGAVLRKADQAGVGDNIELQLGEGRLLCEVRDILPK